MEKEYWLGRWARGETGWHQAEVEPALIANFSDLPPTRVFVPLCGKSVDLRWLLDQGHEVIGVELSEVAIRAFFTEQGIGFREEATGDFTRFVGEKITIFQGDFFKLRSSDLGKLGAVYDRAALIALPPELRARYAERMFELIGESAKAPGFRFLQIVLERKPDDQEGPPHSVCFEELSALYGARFAIAPLGREPLGTSPSGTEVQECIFLLTRLYSG